MKMFVTVSPHWINAWVLLPLARPFVQVDGAELVARWDHTQVLSVDAGEHLVETFIRYKGFQAKLGIGTLKVEVHQGEEVEIAARNGWANHMPFVPKLVYTGS